MSENNREKADALLLWIHENESRLKHNVKKNITYDPELFSEVWSDSLVRIYENILRTGKEIRNRDYFVFTCVKWNYINAQTSDRNRTRTHVRLDDAFGNPDDCPEDETYGGEPYAERLADLTERLTAAFGAGQTEIFLDYWRGKTQRGGVSYAEIAEDHGVPTETVRRIVRELTDFARTLPLSKYKSNENSLF